LVEDQNLAEASHGGEPGEVSLVTKDSLVVRTGNGWISVQEIQQEGRKRMGIAEFLRGFQVKAGETFA
jgi:methionyl-tRNA formyltransferase